MHLKRTLIDFIERFAGVTLVPKSYRGGNLFHDLRAALPATRMSVVLDVGANVGQSALKFRHYWPDADIHSFEPVPSTFAELKATVAKTRVKAHNVGLSSAPGEARMSIDGRSDQMRIVKGDDIGNVAIVPLTTVDQFCANNRVDHINLLKIDTEGHDLDVLKGAERMIEEGRVDVIQVEAAMNSTNTLHVPIESFRQWLEPKGYVLFGLYEQFGNAPQLRRTNPVFISNATVQVNIRRQAAR